MNPLYLAIAERAAHRCEYCRAPESIFNFPFEVEHIVPASHGGVGDPSNLALACRAYDLFKADRLQAVDDLTSEAVGVFNPRQQRWEEQLRTLVSTAGDWPGFRVQ